MRKIKALFNIFIISGTLNSCLVTTAPRYHYFISTNNIEKNSIKVTIFSTPKYKDYVVTNTDLNAQVLIKSPIFKNPNEFYLMQNQDFFEKKAKQYQIAKRDGKYYRTDDYKSITLKIISEGDEKIINYKISVDDTNKLIVDNRSTKDTTYYFLLDKNRDTVLKLDPKKYFVCFSDTVVNFLVVAPRNRKGWWAIDLKENFLFQVYNTSLGEPSPDKLIDGKIRIIDKKKKIGYANEKGEIIIKPQFEFATEFSKGKAIIGQGCKKVPWEKHQDGVDDHYSIVCDKYGYINEQGQIMELGNFTYEQIAKKINFGG